MAGRSTAEFGYDYALRIRRSRHARQRPRSAIEIHAAGAYVGSGSGRDIDDPIRGVTANAVFHHLA